MESSASNGRVAIVTGGARGIGAAVAKRLARDGFTVGIFDLHEEDCGQTLEDIRRDGGSATATSVDVSDEEAGLAGVARVAQELGPPTVLVNNAGITRDNLLFRMGTADWDAVMGVHLRGAFFLTRAVQKYMVDASWGRIINMSSTSALGRRGQVNYAAAKAGLQGLTKTLAIELGRFGITANAIAPGFIATKMGEETATRMGVPWEQLLEEGAKEIPVGRVGVPDDIAAVASFFAREDSAFVTGQILYVAGGPVI